MNKILNLLDKYLIKEDKIIAAGIAVFAKDTGRVLLLQRAIISDDKNSGLFEFPGGKLEENENAKEGALRDWKEEVGVKTLPKGEFAEEWISDNGKYKLFVYRVLKEKNIKINVEFKDRKVDNPDNKNGKYTETCIWFDIKHLKKNPLILRPEVRETDWQIFTNN